MILVFFTRGRSHEGVPSEEILDLLKRSHENRKRLYRVCAVVAGALWDPSGVRMGFVLLDVADPQDVRTHFQNDPYLAQGFMGIEVYPVTALRLDLNKPDAEIAETEHTLAFVEGHGPDDSLPDFSRLLSLPEAEAPRVVLQRRAGDSEDTLGGLAFFATARHNDVRALLENTFPDLPPGHSWTLHVWKQLLAKGVLV